MAQRLRFGKTGQANIASAGMRTEARNERRGFVDIDAGGVQAPRFEDQRFFHVERAIAGERARAGTRRFAGSGRAALIVQHSAGSNFRLKTLRKGGGESRAILVGIRLRARHDYEVVVVRFGK
jgi:hypothetical protein